MINCAAVFLGKQYVYFIPFPYFYTFCISFVGLPSIFLRSLPKIASDNHYQRIVLIEHENLNLPKSPLQRRPQLQFQNLCQLKDVWGDWMQEEVGFSHLQELASLHQQSASSGRILQPHYKNHQRQKYLSSHQNNWRWPPSPDLFPL